MNGFRSILRLFLALACLSSARAQVAVQIQLEKRALLGGEPVAANVTITNQSGQDITFQGSNQLSWIEFIVKGSRDNVLTPIGAPTFGKVTIPYGQSLSRRVDLARLFPLREPGNYSVYAVVRFPGETHEGFMSNRVLFSVQRGTPFWTQRVGVKGTSGQTREFRVLRFDDGQKTYLYAQVADVTTGKLFNTMSLGECLMFRQPTITVDQNKIMHVLYQLTPAIWGCARIGPDGRFLGRDLFKQAGGPPSLTRANSGTIHVAGGIPFDPVAEAEARSRVRRASDRPNIPVE